MSLLTHDPFESARDRVLDAECTPDEVREQACPGALRDAEAAAIRERRGNARLAADAPVVGVALSGGGIRSATFCLGLFQALARQKLIRKIDYLSTVSGGGYFGSFLGCAFARHGQNADTVEAALADNRSWAVHWLRKNGRFLSPNGAGDNWLSAAIALRNWIALHAVLLTFGFALLGFAALVRADLSTLAASAGPWLRLELFFWDHVMGQLWWSPWLLLAAIPFFTFTLPAGVLYWFTQFGPVMSGVRRAGGLVSRRLRLMPTDEFSALAQNLLTHGFKHGLVPTVALFGFALVDSIGQTVYHHWSLAGFGFPSLWTLLTAAATGLFGFGAKFALVIERVLGSTKLRVPLNALALVGALTWSLLIVLGLSVAAAGFGWNWQPVWNGSSFQPMTNAWPLFVVVVLALLGSWIFSRNFGFVNLSSMQQVYAARLVRAYLGASNPQRRRHANHSMTDLIPGDDLPLDDYLPHRHGGPLHLINLTVNETLSGKTNIERRDRKGLAMAVGPCGMSVGQQSHGLWGPAPRGSSRLGRLQAGWERRWRAIEPVAPAGHCPMFHVFAPPAHGHSRRVEALSLGRWAALSGAAFTTGSGATTCLGLSLLLGLANVRLGYWWDSGISPGEREGRAGRPGIVELCSRVLAWLLPVQTCLMNEFFARFHGPARRHWYLSDGGHFENTGCYELIRRRVPFIICSDAGQDAAYRFDDLANLVRKARTDFGAEVEIVRRAAERLKDDPNERFPLPDLEDVVHPALLDVIGTPEDFPSLEPPPVADTAPPPPAETRARRHALLARIHYQDDDTFSWLLVIKPSLVGDEAADVLQYQLTHPLFPQEPTTDQYFDEAQWESYRKLGEHIGAQLFTPPRENAPGDRSGWSPGHFCPPPPPRTAGSRDSGGGLPPTPAAELTVSLAKASTRQQADLSNEPTPRRV